MTILTSAEVEQVRSSIASARERALARFREAFDRDASAPPNERWRLYLELYADELLRGVDGVGLRDGFRVAYAVGLDGRRVLPVAIAHDASPPGADVADRLAADSTLFPFVSIDRTPQAMFAWWMISSELLASAAWQLTKIIATAEEYADALRKVTSPQIVRALVGTWAPAAEWRADGSGILEVTVWARSGEERIERRTLLIGSNAEPVFHGRELIAEGTGGVGES